MTYNTKHFDFSMFEDVLQVQKEDGRVKHLGASNIDMAVESNGRCLFVDWLDDEARDEPWKNEGKIIFAKRVSKVFPELTYILVTGDVENQTPEYVSIVKHGLLNLRNDDRSRVLWTPCNRAKLIQHVKDWVQEA